jgi:anaerobic selenocysteine-containing dehydrogenase
VVVPVSEGDERRIKNGRGEWITRQDAHPNSSGARLMGLRTVAGDELEAWLGEGDQPVVVLDSLAHPWLANDDAAKALAGRKVAVCGRLQTPIARAAELVLPTASWIETEGTYTSSTGRVQLARRGLFPAGQARTMREILSLVAVQLGLERDAHPTAREIFLELAAEVPAFAGMTYRRLEGEAGLPVLEEAPHVA